VAAALAALFAVGQLAGFLHLVTVRHQRCAEHGEVVDVQARRSPSVAARDDQRARLDAAEPGDRDHRHEHCALAPQRRDEAALLPQQAPLAQPPPCLAQSPVPVETPPALGHALYRLAPKTSPPA